MKVTAVYENGVFRPTEPVSLPESATVEFEPRVVNQQPPQQERVYAFLSKRFRSGQRDVAERHDEHQP